VRAVALSLSAAAVVALATAWACLPDLVVTPVPTAWFCGDGIISPDAGEQCDPGPDAATAAYEVCPNCSVACASGQSVEFPDPASNHCYFTSSLTTITDIDAAGEACVQNGGHVVRFVSEAEVSLVANRPGEAYWVGLRDPQIGDRTWFPSDTTNEPGWSPQCAGCFAHVDAGVADMPTIDAGRRCVEGYIPVATGAEVPGWTQVGCVGKRLTLCEREPLGTRTFECTPGICFTVAATQTTKRYVLLGQPRLPAPTAASACSGIDGGLVVFQTREEREQVGYEIGTDRWRGGANDFWIGLSSNDAGVWSWDRGEQGLTPPPWGLNEPAPTAVSAARAYVVVEAGTLDSELAHAQTDPAEKHYAVCELR
jgi:hypothetical protein